MKRTILEESTGPLGLARLSVVQYQEMIAKGILAEGAPVELLDGLLVRKDRAVKGGNPTTIGPAHQTAVNKLVQLASRVEQMGSLLLIQGAICLPPDQEPEPDAAVVFGKLADFAHHHPQAGDVHSVIEVADSSLERDRTTKLRIYASAGIPQYIIVNLIDRQVELHYSPDRETGEYGKRFVLRGEEAIDIAVAKSTYLRPAVTVADLLP